MAALSGSVGEIGEFGVVGAVTSRFVQGDDVSVGPGDDAAVLSVPAGHVVASLDMLVQNRHFRLDWSSADDIGHKAAAENLSDINAMGGRATALLVGLGVPASLPAEWAMQFADGLAAEAAEVGASIIGGDLTEADLITVAVTALGVCEAGIVRRSGARPGDVVALAGRQGWAAAGFAVLGRGFRSPRAVVEAHRQPRPPYSAGPQAAAAGATAMIDVSDGLLQDLGHVASASGVAIDIRSRSWKWPIRCKLWVQRSGSTLTFVLTGGDDYSLVATFPVGTPLPDGWVEIGNVVDDAEPGRITVDGALPTQARGHQHFR